MKPFKQQDLQKIATQSIDDVLALFDTSFDGLTDDQVLASTQTYGTNVIHYKKEDSTLQRLIKSFISPFTLVLLLLACVSFVTDYLVATKQDRSLMSVIIIISMVTLSGLVSFFQSTKSSKATAQLALLVQLSTVVKRSKNQAVEHHVDDLVCGDIVYLAAGDMIPADLRLIESHDLFVSQSSMTGESVPIAKKETPIDTQNKTLFDYENLVFMGSNVVSGSAKGVVIAVGASTRFGQIAKALQDKSPKTSFDLGIQSVSLLLLKFMAVMTPLVFIINGLTKGNWLEAFLFSITVAVGLTPEMLPMVVTANLVKGSLGMSKEGTIIKNVNAIQDLGAMDILCTDKTGTLTQDKIILEYHCNPNGVETDRVLALSYLNSYFQTGLRNLMDHAIIASSSTLDLPLNKYRVVGELPFDFNRRCMSVVVDTPHDGRLMITKGAIEEIMAMSTKLQTDTEHIDLLLSHQQDVKNKIDALNLDGFRVIGLCVKQVPSTQDHFHVEDEKDMTFVGYLAFLDPPKDSVKDTLKQLKDHGVLAKVLTGDNGAITKHVCQSVGLEVTSIITGQDLESYNEKAYADAIKNNHIFVKLTPNQKTKIIDELKKQGHVVGYMGDGINDAAALKHADVGISVDTAVDIAKSSADVILLKKDLSILSVGVISGRTIFANIMKYVKITASSNFGNVFSVVIASLFLPFLPMLPIHLLILNLIYDLTSTSLPWDNVDQDYVQQPKQWQASSIRRFMTHLGPVSSIFDLITFVVMFFIICPMVVGGPYHALTSEAKITFIVVFHTGWFIESLWSQTIIVHTLRTKKIPFIQSRASLSVMVVTFSGILFGTILPYTPIGMAIGMHPLPVIYYFWLLCIVALYVVFVGFMKKRYIKQFKELL